MIRQTDFWASQLDNPFDTFTRKGMAGVLNYFTQFYNRPTTLMEVVKKTDLSAVTVARILEELETMGMIMNWMPPNHKCRRLFQVRPDSQLFRALLAVRGELNAVEHRMELKSLEAGERQ